MTRLKERFWLLEPLKAVESSVALLVELLAEESDLDEVILRY